MADEKTDAEKQRLKQAEKLLALFKEAHGRPARTLYELREWADSAEGKAALAYDLGPDGKIIPDL
jgi:hypothetical protein